MNNIVTIAGVQSARITYKGRPICTTQQLAQFYGCDPEHILDNHRKNPDRFEEGKHFVRIDGDAFREFKEGLPENIREPMKFAPKAILWTELGAARHAKMLTTDKAWDVYEEMEEAYFQRKEAAVLDQPAKPTRASERYREAAAITRDQLKICKLLGVDEGMAKVITAKEVRNATGLDFTPLLTNVTATNNPRVPVSELVKQIEGSTSELINTALEELGFQTKERWTSHGKPRSKWVLTEAGKQYGALAPYQAEENAHSGLRPVWFASVLELVRPLVEVAIAQRTVAKARNARPAKAPATKGEAGQAPTCPASGEKSAAPTALNS